MKKINDIKVSSPKKNKGSSDSFYLGFIFVLVAGGGLCIYDVIAIEKTAPTPAVEEAPVEITQPAAVEVEKAPTEAPKLEVKENVAEVPASPEPAKAEEEQPAKVVEVNEQESQPEAVVAPAEPEVSAEAPVVAEVPAVVEAAPVVAAEAPTPQVQEPKTEQPSVAMMEQQVPTNIPAQQNRMQNLPIFMPRTSQAYMPRMPRM